MLVQLEEACGVADLKMSDLWDQGERVHGHDKKRKKVETQAVLYGIMNVQLMKMGNHSLKGAFA